MSPLPFFDLNLQPDHSIDLSLSRIKEALEELGNPHLKLPPVIHVAGTNGKGSTLAYLSAMIKAAGKTYHRYTSPHLIRVNERFIISGKEVSDESLEQVLLKVHPFSLTPFEEMTAAAMLLFSQTPADYVLLETGMGGRLDATNVIMQPLVTLITSISFDHEAFLGNTIESIAHEKAGIIKKEVPVILAHQHYPQARRVIIEKARILQAPVLEAEPYQGNIGLLGPHQQDNAGVAVLAARAILKLSESEIVQGLKEVDWPGRLQELRPGLWIDGAHNLDAFKNINRIVEGWWPTAVTLVLGLQKRRDPQPILEIISQMPLNRLYVVESPADHDYFKFWPSSELKKYSEKVGLTATPLETLEEIFNIKEEGITLVAGSLHMIGKIIENYKG